MTFRFKFKLELIINNKKHSPLLSLHRHADQEQEAQASRDSGRAPGGEGTPDQAERVAGAPAAGVPGAGDSSWAHAREEESHLIKGPGTPLQEVEEAQVPRLDGEEGTVLGDAGAGDLPQVRQHQFR